LGKKQFKKLTFQEPTLIFCRRQYLLNTREQR